MCGIVGIYNFNKQPAQHSDIKRMADAMHHRGPDAEGFLVRDNVALGNRRLSIIDLSAAGNQPVYNERKNLAIFYNGEVYNFLELKSDLSALGHQFHSNTDTEVILHLYEQYGHECLKKLKGMFAFAIFDLEKNVIFGARDPLGIKPLYYFCDSSQTIFASEVKSILQIDGTKKGVDFGALNEYFTFQNVFSESTMFAGIKLLPGGSYFTLSSRGMEIKQYWDPVFKARSISSENDLVHELRFIVDKAVKRHLIADVPVGSYLSGGMDSASIASLANQYSHPIKTFCIGFNTAGASGIEAFFDERKDAEIVANSLLTDHYEMVLNHESMQRVIEKLIWHLEDLRVGMSYPNYYASELASKYCKVVLSGAGGDELFGGYPWRYQVVSGKTDQTEFNEAYYQYWSRLIPDHEKKLAFLPHIYQEFLNSRQPREAYQSVIAKAAHLDPISKALYFEMKTFLSGLLIVGDKLSMAHSLEERLPLLDLDLVEFALSIPVEYKCNSEFGKIILRKALSGVLPEEIINRKKQGFSPPDASWYRAGSLPFIKGILEDKNARIYEYFNRQYVSDKFNEHMTAQANNRLLIWSLLSFEYWLRQYI